MTVTPMRAAKIANAQREITEILHKQMCPYAESAARQVIDELRKLGWTPPGWADDEAVPQPSYSTPAGRARARELYEATLRARRTTVNPPAQSAETGD